MPCLVLFGATDLTQGLVLPRQALYQLGYTPPFLLCVFKFRGQVSLSFLGWPSALAGIIVMCIQAPGEKLIFKR